MIGRWIIATIRGVERALGRPSCRVCGCTWYAACEEGGGCHWVEPNLCSACVGKPGADKIGVS